MSDYAVRLEDVSVVLGGDQILERVSAAVPLGSCTMVVGPNGAGKTTLLTAILGQVPYSGRILLGTTENGRPLRVGYVPQKIVFDRGLPMTVLELMATPRQSAPLWFGVHRPHRKAAEQVLAMVNAEHLKGRPLGALSVGELQRVLLALALLRDPDLLMLDEPTAGMDIGGEILFCDLIEQLRRQRRFTQLMVTHDLATVTYHATHVICLNRTVIAQGPPETVLTAENRLAAFGVHQGLPRPGALPDVANNRREAEPSGKQ